MNIPFQDSKELYFMAQKHEKDFKNFTNYFYKIDLEEQDYEIV